MKQLLSSKSVVAIGLDPEKGIFHGMLRIGKQEINKSYPMMSQHKIIFDIVAGCIKRYL